MNRLKYRIASFMQGRRGVDEFGRFLLIAAVVFIFASMFLGRFRAVEALTNLIGLALLIYAYFRIFSRNLYAREKENRKYLERKNRGKTPAGAKQGVRDRKNYAYFRCPGCGMEMKAPKGKGKIRVVCHQCNTEFEKKV